VWTVHRVLGLAFGALILLASVTGGVLVIHKELERIVERDLHTLAAAPTAPALPKTPIVQALAPTAPEGFRPMRFMLARGPLDTERLIFLGPDGRTRWTTIVNPYTGEVVWRGADQALFTSWLLGLHMHLRLGGWGYVITAVGGIGLVLLGVTGTIYSLKIAPGQIAPPKPLGETYDLTRLAPLEPALATARERFPEGQLIRVSFPTTPAGALSILVLERDAPVWRKFSRVDFEPDTGALRAVHDARDGTLSQKLNGMLAPLHFGFYGSTLVKWLYFVGGFAPALLALTGTAIWYLRTRKTARPVRGPGKP
jgi:uncharacterized iron-regulated membrane protein